MSAETPVAETKKGMSKGLKTALSVVAALVLVAVVVFFGMVNFGFFETHTTAITANGHELTPAMTNYYYTNAYSNMSDLLSYMTDTSLSLDEQECSLIEGGTWSDYLLDYAANTAANTYAVYDEAVANGYTLSEDAQTSISTELETLEMMATLYGYSSADAMLAGQYGRGCDVESYEEFLTVNYIAQEYTNKIYNEFTYTQEDIDAHYAENSADFDGYSFRMYELTVPEEEASEETEEETVDAEALSACEETAKAMAEASKGNEQVFIDLALENASEDDKASYEDDAATLREDYTASMISDTFRDWITDEARAEGDTTYVANSAGNGYYVVYFIGAVDHNYQLPNVRHILIGVDDTTDTEAMAAAKTEAEALLDEFLAGDATEDAFAALATEHSTDTGSTENGGLYENIAPGSMVDAFDAWCFDESREIGDTGIVETEYGYHVMYFSGYGETYQNYLVETSLLSDDYTAWQESVTADMTYEVISDRYVTTR